MSTLSRRWPLPLAILMLGACTPALMRTPNGLEEVEPWPVSGHSPRWRNEALSFGPYQTRKINEGTRLDWAVPVHGGHVSGGGRTYRYALDSGHQVDCREREFGLRKRGYEVDLTGAVQPRLSCAIRTEAGETFAMQLGEGARGFEGEVETPSGRLRYEIGDIRDFEGSGITSGETLGFELTWRGQAIAAVETINAGRVWIDPDVDPAAADDVAAVIAGLLLFRPDGGEAFDP